MATNDSPLLTVREVRDLKDKTIMRRVQAGDAAALGILFERYSRLVLNGAMRILRDRAEAQDLLQNVFLYILRRGCMFDPARGTVASWVLQLTYSRSLNRRNGYLTRLSLKGSSGSCGNRFSGPGNGS
jgi:RNA polymerase sigma-70 factor (ECF subfamily)